LYVTILLFIVGFALIIKGGDYFVGSSVAIARHARLPRLIIGTTIVSIATTSPEFIVSTTASATGQPDIAIGNAVGSAIANIGFILGFMCILRPIAVKREEFNFPSFSLLAAAVLLTLLTIPLFLSRARGFLLLAVGIFYLIFDYFRHKRRSAGKMPVSEEEYRDPRMKTLRRAVFFFLFGLALVVGGSKLLIDSAVEIAQLLGVPPLFIGLTFIAIGTSLPELVTAITSFSKGVADLSLGNIVGAGLLNCTVITGTAAAICPLPMTRTTQLYNLPALILIVATLIVLARTRNNLSRLDGAILFCLYAAYVAGLVLLRGH
jgi:cation:H+ antiporter